MINVTIVGGVQSLIVDGASLFNNCTDTLINLVLEDTISVDRLPDPCACGEFDDGYERSAYYKSAMRRQAKYNEAPVQQRRKALAKFHKEKRVGMARKQAQKRHSRFV
jgi:hypothetical protein